MDEFHMNAFTCVQNDILKRIKSKAINDEIMKIFVKQANNKYVHYFEKNQLLVENEKRRLQMIEEQRLHKEKLAKQKAEADERMQRLELERERERRQHEKDQAKRQKN
uniref:Uncharacterized protein n=1 Tax=Panagrolaimus superbus TaxID=310955 RepID=A0A914YT00_9BILA